MTALVVRYVPWNVRCQAFTLSPGVVGECGKPAWVTVPFIGDYPLCVDCTMRWYQAAFNALAQLDAQRGEHTIDNTKRRDP